MSSCHAATTLARARNLLQSAVPTIPAPPTTVSTSVSTETLSQARNVLKSAPEASLLVSVGPLPGLEHLQSLYKGSLAIVNHAIERLQVMLSTAGEMGKKLCGLINENRAIVALVTATAGSVVLVVVASKYFLVKVPEGQQALLSPDATSTLLPGAPDPTASTDLELVELELMRCPITLSPLIDPVLAADGHTYERQAIELWFQSGQRLSPMTGEALPSLNLIPNLIVRQTQDQLLGGLLD